MNKENSTKGAAGLRRSAVAERIRLREEWSALKGTETTVRPNVLAKKQTNSRQTPSNFVRKKVHKMVPNSAKADLKDTQPATEVLRGVVALVDVGDESRALPLRAALAALGATVVGCWIPLVTHLIWTDGGSRPTRAKARALGCNLVSPLWVEACAASTTKLNERTFPTASRQSDLPSPRTLRQLLKRAEAENVPLVDLLSDSKEDDSSSKLRISTDSEQDTSVRTTDTSNDTVDVESRVNTAPRRALPHSTSAVIADRPSKSRRKLFTHKEGEIISKGSEDESDTTAPAKPKRVRIQHTRLAHRDNRDLIRAERMARRILSGCHGQNSKHNITQTTAQPRIVLTGMSGTERQAVTKAIRELNGRIQRQVDKRTTHVLLGSCRQETANTHKTDITGITSICELTKTAGSTCYLATDKRARTLNALIGAARGCRVLYAQWAIDGAVAKKWLHHHGYEVHHLRKICQKARVERTALGRTQSDYAYDVFNGMRVRMMASAEQKDAATQLLKLCGAVVQDGGDTDGTQNGRRSQDGGRTQNGGRLGCCQYGGLTQFGGQTAHDIIIGSGEGEISSKWVFDSVAAGRMRTTRKYITSGYELELQFR